jgi:hypothetical protein
MAFWHRARSQRWFRFSRGKKEVMVPPHPSYETSSRDAKRAVPSEACTKLHSTLPFARPRLARCCARRRAKARGLADSSQYHKANYGSSSNQHDVRRVRIDLLSSIETWDSDRSAGHTNRYPASCIYAVNDYCNDNKVNVAAHNDDDRHTYGVPKKITTAGTAWSPAPRRQERQSRQARNSRGNDYFDTNWINTKQHNVHTHTITVNNILKLH